MEWEDWEETGKSQKIGEKKVDELEDRQARKWNKLENACLLSFWNENVTNRLFFAFFENPNA